MGNPIVPYSSVGATPKNSSPLDVTVLGDTITLAKTQNKDFSL